MWTPADLWETWNWERNKPPLNEATELFITCPGWHQIPKNRKIYPSLFWEYLLFSSVPFPPNVKVRPESSQLNKWWKSLPGPLTSQFPKGKNKMSYCITSASLLGVNYDKGLLEPERTRFFGSRSPIQESLLSGTVEAKAKSYSHVTAWFRLTGKRMRKWILFFKDCL